jgi:acetoin utilization deacetylase AcuC-like enzyme
MTRTALYRSPIFGNHDEPSHVENQRRLVAVDAALERNGLLVDRPQPQFGPATFDQLARVHEPGYIEALTRAAEQGGGWIDNDTYLEPDSVEVAALAQLVPHVLGLSAGAALQRIGPEAGQVVVQSAHG